MNLDAVQIELRPRSHWEAIDLGCLMVRRWAGPLYASWFLVATPVFLLTWLLLPSSPIWASLIIWWLKPVYERLPLVIISGAIFGETPSLSAALKNARTVIPPGLLSILTYRRLSFNRAFETPVTVLEKLSSRDRTQRFSILNRSVGNQSLWLTVLGVHIELFLALGFVTGVYLLIPEQTEIDWWGLLVSNASGELDWLSNLLYFLAIGLVGPVYVASGFSLYLNRRVELEAWDIELGFKRIVSKVTSSVLLVCLFTIITPLLTAAESVTSIEDAPANPESSRQIIEQVLGGDDYHEISSVKVPKFLEEYFESETEIDVDDKSLKDWDLIFQMIASVVEILLWLGVVALIIYVAMRFQVWEYVKREPSESRKRPTTLMGMKIDDASLPDDVEQEAVKLWDQGDVRGALSLLYRASLATLFTRFGVHFFASDTEGECLAKTRKLNNDTIVNYFSHLTRSWQMLAYAHINPSDADFIKLVDGWPFDVENKS